MLNIINNSPQRETAARVGDSKCKFHVLWDAVPDRYVYTKDTSFEENPYHPASPPDTAVSTTAVYEKK